MYIYGNNFFFISMNFFKIFDFGNWMNSNYNNDIYNKHNPSEEEKNNKVSLAQRKKEIEKKKESLKSFDEEMDEFTKQIFGDDHSNATDLNISNEKKEPDNNNMEEDQINYDNIDADDYQKYMDDLIKKEEEKVAKKKIKLDNDRERKNLEYMENYNPKKLDMKKN